MDFGIDSSSHLGAIQFTLREGLVTPEELDSAMGKGAALTGIAQRGDNPYRDVTFETSWDRLTPEPESPPEVPPTGQQGRGPELKEPGNKHDNVPSAYERKLQEAAEAGKYRSRDDDKGRDR